MKLNTEQQKIIDTFINNNKCFVNASAGTGKTSTITQAYIKLLEQKEKVSNIVVITFTKAAANEMTLRIRQNIRKKIIDSTNTSEKEYWQSVYKNILIHSKISTIHSFAQNIVKEYAMYLGIAPKFSVLEEDTNFYEALQENLLQLLNEKEYSNKIRNIFRIYTEDSKNLFIKDIYNFILQIKPRLESIENFEEASLSYIDITDNEYKKLHTSIINYAESLINDNTLTGKTIDKCKDELKSLINKLKYIKNKNELYNIDIYTFEEIRIALSYKLTVLSKKNAEEFKQTIKDLKTLNSKMSEYIERLYYKDKYEYIINFIKDSFYVFEKLKKQMSTYSYDDLVSIAIEALEIDFISDEIRENIKALILDEAQDTSKLQFSFINLLIFGSKDIDKNIYNNDKKLLIVGDRKQSIYRFRDANLNEFMRLQNIFKNNSVYLQTNYRSNSMLIDFFNEIFQKTVFINDDINYTDNDNIKSNKEEKNKKVSLLLLNNNFEDDSIKLYSNDKIELEAYAIAEYIKKNLKNDYKNTAILFPTLTKLNIYLEALSKYNIPYYTDGGRGFFQREEINNIILFLRYLILKEYSILPHLIMTDFFNYNINDISDFSNSLLQINLDLRDFFPLHSDNYEKALIVAKEKAYYNNLINIKNILVELEKIAHTTTTVELIEIICSKTNYYEYLMTKEDAEIALSNIEKLKRLAINFENQSGKNSYDFIINILIEKNDIAYSTIPKIYIDAVKIMTIHKSKGLEFKNVFLANNSHNKNNNINRFEFIENYPSINIPIINNFKSYTVDYKYYDKEYNKNAELSEKKRLFYVALTRASENLIIPCEVRKIPKNIDNEKNTSYRDYINSYLPEIRTYFQLNNEYKSENIESIDYIEINNSNKYINYYAYGININKNKEIVDNTIEIIKEKINNRHNTQNTKESNISKLKYIKPSIVENTEKDENNFIDIKELINKKLSLEYTSYDNHQNNNKQKISPIDIGTITHQILEYFDFNNYIKNKDKYIKEIINNTIKHYSFYDINNLEYRLNNYLKKFLENEHIINIINNKETIISREHKFQKREIKDKTLYITNAQIDLLTKDDNNNYYIIDYKTTKYTKEKEEYYQKQLNIYKDIVCDLFKIENKNNIKTNIIFLG